ncbi:MAG: hypothetical protein EPN17_08610, partial [Methylobacter sp.]
MKWCYRLVPLLVAMVMFAYGPAVWAVACTSVATGNWNAAATWNTACRISGGNATNGPGADDTATIANLSSNHVVTVTANAAATSVTFTGGNRGSQLVLNSGVALNVTGPVTINAASSTTAGRSKILNIGSGTLTATSIAITAGTTNNPDYVTVSTGTMTTSGSITFSGTAANARFISTGASMVNVGGNFADGGTLTTSGTGTINFNGGVAQTIGAYATYNNIQVNNTAGGVQFTGATTLGGTLTLNGGILSVGANTLTLNGPAIAGSPSNLSTTSSSNLIFGGSSAGVTLPGSVTALNNLTINNTNGVSLGGSSVTTTLSGTLTL